MAREWREGGHYLRKNHTTRTPVRVVCFDTESWLMRNPLGSAHRFRMAVASFDVRRSTERAKERTEWGTFDDKTQLWEWITGHTTKNHATWVYAHNLEYDLTVSDGWEILPALGWEVTARAAGGSAPWVKWRKDGRTLVMADLHGWAHTTLKKVGDWLDIPKLKMPPEGASLERWQRYCRRDTEVLRAAVLRLMNWVDTDDLGNWSLSAAGQAWRVFRHRHMDEKLLVHSDKAASDLERYAAFGGRREAFQIGRWNRETIVNLDFRNHYMNVAGRTRLPTRLAGVVESPDIERVIGWATSLAVIAEVEVETEMPVAPVRTGAGIIYPVGTFTTTLAWPEIALVLEYGGKVKVRRCALYRAAPILQPWANWLHDQLHGDTAETDPLLAHVLKGWSRELIGKFGQRSSELVRIGAPAGESRDGEVYFPAAGRHPVFMVEREDGVYLPDRSRPGENALPAVFAYVTSAARVALWRALEAVGWENVITCDTDGMLALGGGVGDSLQLAAGAVLEGSGDVWQRGSWWVAADPERFPGALQVKAVHRQLEVRTPEALIIDGKPRISGLAGGASRLGPWEFQAEQWPGADWQRGNRGEADYRTVVRPYVVRADYTRREVLTDGSTRPWRFRLTEVGNECPRLGLAG